MAVVVQLSRDPEDQYKKEDSNDIAIGYRINANGALSIVAKPMGKPAQVVREYSPAAYIWVEGKRFTQDVDKQAGVDGTIALNSGGTAQFL